MTTLLTILLWLLGTWLFVCLVAFAASKQSRE